MAKKIELGLELKGEDARDFQRYLQKPDYTPRGKEVLRRAYEISKSRGNQG